MGYETDYNGIIYLNSEKAIKIITKLVEDKKYPFEDEFEEIELTEDCDKDGSNKEVYLSINCGWKEYENEMEKICLFVSLLDKKAKGIIDCRGEENDDFWRIVIGGGKVVVEQGHIEYSKNGREEFNDTETKKKVYEITKDKKLLKEVMVESL